jgi:hypothetical protein
MQDGGGPVVERAKVVLIFRGPGWTDGAPTTAAVEQMFAAVLASPYASELVQYRGVRRPRLVDTTTDAGPIGHLGPDPRGFLTTQVLLIDTDEITQAVRDARMKGSQEPIGDDALYLVIVSGAPLPIFSEGRFNNAGGFHETFLDNGKSVTYGVVLNLSTNTLDNIWNSQMGLPATLSHEMVEALTDPDTATGFRLDGGDEIGDLNDVRPIQLLGLTQIIGLAAYFSDLEGGPVMPTSYSLKKTFGIRASESLASVHSVIRGTSVLAEMRDRLEP